MIYSKKLKELRTENALSQEAVANIIDIERGTYSQYECEYIIMPIKHFNALCNYFDVSMDYLFNFTDVLKYKKYLMEINTKIAGERLKEFRKLENITQAKLASILNTNQSVIANYERGRNIIATPFLYEICKKYNVSADYLLGKIDSPIYFK